MPIHFQQGTSSTEVAGGVPRGLRDCFSIRARPGQHLYVTQPRRVVTNIVIQIYRPPWYVRHDDNGFQVIGYALPRAGEGDDATHWSGELPVAGTYLLVVGTSWGSGEYRLRVAIN